MLCPSSKACVVGVGCGVGRGVGRKKGLIYGLVSLFLLACPAKPDAGAVAPGHGAEESEARIVDQGSEQALEVSREENNNNNNNNNNGNKNNQERAAGPVIRFANTSDLELRYQGEGRAKVASAGALVVLEGDYRHLRAIDPVTGAERWRLLAQDEAHGMHELHSYGDRLLLHAGRRLVIVDARQGRRLGEAAAVRNGGGCRLQIEGDACAYVCECMLQLIDCASGIEVGPSYLSSENHIYVESDEHDSVCPIRPRLLGRKDDLTVALVEGKDGLMGAVALDRGGTARWRREGLLTHRGTFSAGWIAAGMAPDGGTCWLADLSGGELEVFDCASGKKLWRTVVATDKRYFQVALLPVDGGRLWLQTGGEKGGSIEVRDLWSGRRIWAHETDPGISPWPRTLPFARTYLSPPTKLQIYDGGRGKVLRELELEVGSVLVDDPRGGFLLADDQLTEFDEQVKIRRRRPRALVGLLWAMAEHLVVMLPDGAGALVLRREDLAESMRIDGEVAFIKTPGLGADVMLFEAQRGDAPTRLFLVGPRR
ncbi:MAG TPA: hypothetical protein ENK31_10060, partial [Nannocystis exedens]|nr:hypothetical protein [Nannocystis exedens]